MPASWANRSGNGTAFTGGGILNGTEANGRNRHRNDNRLSQGGTPRQDRIPKAGCKSKTGTFGERPQSKSQRSRRWPVPLIYRPRDRPHKSRPKTQQWRTEADFSASSWAEPQPDWLLLSLFPPHSPPYRLRFFSQSPPLEKMSRVHYNVTFYDLYNKYCLCYIRFI